jgi:two-component system chemotaxis response regulator CheY
MNEDKTILVEDRSEQDRELLVELLSTYGYRVLESTSPAHTMELLEGDDIDLFLVEVGTPGIGEQTMIEEIRSNPSYEDLPVIVMATTEEVDDVAAWVGSGCNDFILKPVNPRLLYQRVQTLVETHPRAYNRVACNVIADGTTGVEQVTGELKEIGEGGASLVLDRRLATNDIMKLTFTLPSRPGELTLGAEIVHVQESKEGYIHGMRFIILDKDTREKIKQFVRDSVLQDS